ncbi:DinB family protein [bacterium]|nr:MAG: DinB family protein [bacterium]
MNDPYLFIALATSPRTVAYLVRQLDPALLDQPTAEGRFTPREAVAHLADWEPIMRGRLRQTVDRPGSTIVAHDEGERAIRLGYSKLDVEEQLALFARERTETVAYLRQVAPEDWTLRAVHEERGPYTLREQANFFVCHDQYHVEQFLTLLSA